MALYKTITSGLWCSKDNSLQISEAQSGWQAQLRELLVKLVDAD